MKIHLIRALDQPVSLWSGGKTTQLYIYPENAVYRSTPFLFRLSSATVEEEKSAFTKLDGVERTLMILKGSVELKSGPASKKLAPFEQLEFSGGTDIVSSGKCVDYNLMTMGNCRGVLQTIIFEEPQKLEQLPAKDVVAFYLFDGQMNLEIDEKSFTLYPNDILVAFVEEQKDRAAIQVQTMSFAKAIRTDISF